LGALAMAAANSKAEKFARLISLENSIAPQIALVDRFACGM